MRTLPSLIVAACVCGVALVPASADDCCGDNPAIRSIDRTCLPAGKSPGTVPLYRSDLNEQYQEIANIDSFISLNRCEDTTRMQLKDLQAKAQAVGADALIRVRPLANKIQGWQENPDTPFFSVRQGASEDHFFRATAIKYVKMPNGEPEPMSARTASQVAVRQASPLIDTNSLLKANRGRTRRHEMTVPEVYSTQQPGPVAF